MGFASKTQEKTVSEPVSELMKLAAKSRPRKRNSKLDPYLDELRELQSQGYSLAQMEEFLAQINVTVSRQTIHDFLKRRANTPQVNKPKKESNEQKTKNTVDSQNITTPKSEKKENPFANKIQQNSSDDVRREDFTYNPIPDKSKIYKKED